MEATRGLEPHSRETRIAQSMIEAADAHPEYQEGDKTIVMYLGAEWNGIAHGGYPEADDDAGPLADIFMALHAMFAANGVELSMVPIKQRGQG